MSTPRVAWCAALLAALAGCHAPAPRTPAPERAPAPPDTREPLDASYDWHVLVIAPFGSVLKDIPLALHEVLLFHDETQTHGTAQPAAAAAECYTADAPPAPRFFENTPDEFLLCFENDRLSRIEATVRPTARNAAAQFAAACAAWLKHAAAGDHGAAAQNPASRAPATSATGASVTATGTPGASVTATGTPGASVTATGTPADAPAADGCEGREDAVHFSARLDVDSENTVSVTLDSAPDP